MEKSVKKDPDALNFNNTKEIKIHQKMIDQVVGQEHAANVIKKAASQRRHVFLIGEPGTGKSMLGQALAELLPKEKLVDILAFPNPHDENKPLVRAVPAGTGRDLVLRSKLEGANMFKNQNIILFLIAILVSVGPYLGYKYKIFPFDQPVIYAASMITSMALIIGIVMIMNFGKKMGLKAQVPKIIVDNANVEKVPFYDATGAHAGALLGDVLHDPFQCIPGDQLVHKENSKPIPIKTLIDPFFDRISLNNQDKKSQYEIELPTEQQFTVLTGDDNNYGYQKTNVLKVFRRKINEEIVEIETRRGYKIQVTKNHPLAVYKDTGDIEYIRADCLIDNLLVVVPNKSPISVAHQSSGVILLSAFDQITSIKKIPYNGFVYNLTTSVGTYLVNNILTHNTGGLGTPAHERVVAGMIHKANMGVLFIDEIATLEPHTQQELLSSLQNNRYSITGQSERSAGAMVRTEEVPCNYVLVAAGNMETMKNMHPALRSRIRGYGYEVYMKETIEDTPENQFKIAMFVAQEVTNDKKIPHFDKEAVLQIIEEAQRRANRKGHLTLRLRELGGLIRAAGDIALEDKSELVSRKHVLKAKLIAKTLEQQIADRYIERKKEYAIIRVAGKQVGRVNGLAVIGDGASYSGIILPIESEVTPGGKESEIIATGKLGEIAKEAIKNVSAIIKKLFGEDIKGTCDIYVQFLQTYEGVEGDSASIAVATSVISALKKVPIKQNYAMTGSLSVRGEVLPIGGISAKVEAAIEAGIKFVIVPESNLQDIVLSQDKLKKIKIVPVKNIKEVLTEVMDWSKHRKILEKIKES